MPEQTSASNFERYLDGMLLASGTGAAWRSLVVQHLRRPPVQAPFVVPAVAEVQLVWIVRGRALVEERDGPDSRWHGGEVGLPAH